jgi:D-serine deaminase-like pyridoxal phosphate-dependent protein
VGRDVSSLTGATYERFRRAIEGERLPLAIVDMDALDANADQLFAEVRYHGKTLRIATKSVRRPAIIEYLLDRGGDTVRGLMAFTVEEAVQLTSLGHTDILVAYPSMQPSDIECLAAVNQRCGVRVTIIVDSEAQLDALDARACDRDATIPVAIEADMSLRIIGGRLRLGVYRSPLHSADDVVRIADAIKRRAGLELVGIMGYEAQVAGMGEANPFFPAFNLVKSAIKKASVPTIRKRRQQIADALAVKGMHIDFFNGGGTGSLNTTGRERSSVTTNAL